MFFMCEDKVWPVNFYFKHRKEITGQNLSVFFLYIKKLSYIIYLLFQKSFTYWNIGLEELVFLIQKCMIDA